MWKWIKKFLTIEKQKPLVLKEEVKIDLSKTTKGDRKKLYAAGKITAEQLQRGK